MLDPLHAVWYCEVIGPLGLPSAAQIPVGVARWQDPSRLGWATVLGGVRHVRIWLSSRLSIF
jgi:hypothetical protein